MTMMTTTMTATGKDDMSLGIQRGRGGRPLETWPPATQVGSDSRPRRGLGGGVFRRRSFVSYVVVATN